MVLVSISGYWTIWSGLAWGFKLPTVQKKYAVFSDKKIRFGLEISSEK